MSFLFPRLRKSLPHNFDFEDWPLVHLHNVAQRHIAIFYVHPQQFEKTDIRNEL